MGIFDTVFNEERAIATKGTKHVARTEGPTDLCYPEEGTPKDALPFENYIETHPHLDNESNTESTFINDYRIWIAEGLVGDGSNSKDAHEPHILKKKDGAEYRQEAEPVTYSLTVKAEGRGVVRTDDKTFQNGRNTSGYVDGSEVELTRELNAAHYKNACKLEKIDGYLYPPWVNGARGAPQELGQERPGVGARNYLEVFNGDEVNFVARRFDTTGRLKRERLECMLEPNHTIWNISRTGYTESKHEEANGDQYDVGSDWTDVGLETGGALKVGGSTGSAADRVGADEAMVDVANAAVDVVKWFRAANDPPTIDVVANACSGARTARLVVKPKGPVKFGVSFDVSSPDRTWEPTNHQLPQEARAIRTFAELQSKINEVRFYVGLFSQVRNAVVPGPVQPVVKFSILDGVSFELGCEYKRCTRVGTGFGGRPFSPTHIGREWYFQISASPLVNIEIGVEVGLLQLGLALVSGGAASVIGEVLRKVLGGDPLTLRFTFSFTINLTGRIALDQHDVVDGAQLEGRATGALNASVRLDLKLGSGSFQASGDVTGKVIIRTPRIFGELGRYQWDVDAGHKITLTGRVLFAEVEKEFDGPRLVLDKGEGPIALPGGS